MILWDILFFILSLLLVIKGSTLATRYSARIADNYNLSRYVVGFIVVALISILPETIIAVDAALGGAPEFGLGTLFGSNVADLTLVFSIIILFARRGIKIESKVLHRLNTFPFFLFLPLLFGLNGHYSREEGFALIVIGVLFYYLLFRGCMQKVRTRGRASTFRDYTLLVFALVMLVTGSHFTIASAITIAGFLSISPILIGMLVVGVGTTMPELFYSLKSVSKKEDGLAIGDILGTVLADALIVVGVLAIIRPFNFPAQLVYVTGAFMLMASLLLLRFMRSGRAISQKEAFLLLLFWVLYALIELSLGM